MERDSEIRTIRDENIHIQKEMDQQMSSETSVNQELQVEIYNIIGIPILKNKNKEILHLRRYLQEKLDRARERKEELKQQIPEPEEQLEESKRAQW